MFLKNAIAALAKSNLYTRIASSIVLIGILMIMGWDLINRGKYFIFEPAIHAIHAILFFEMINLFLQKRIQSLIITIITLGICYYVNFDPRVIILISLINVFATFKILPRNKRIWLGATTFFFLWIFGFLTFFLPFMYLSDFIIYMLGFIIANTIITDTSAYLIGCKWGKTKLSPSISPNKTMEGAGGAVLTSMAFGIILNAFFPIFPSIVHTIVTAGILSILAQAGDLFESYIKRLNNVKDSSNLIPGHGGLWDRLDSLYFILFIISFIAWIRFLI